MDPKSFEDVKPVIEIIVSALDNEKAALQDAVKDAAIRHDVITDIRTKVMAVVKSYYKVSQGKTQQEREGLFTNVLEKIESILTQEVTSHRDRTLFGKGRLESLEKSSDILQKQWHIAKTDASRVVELANEIKQGNIPNNGRNRKPGTRPEKLSVVKRAEQIAKLDTQDDEPIGDRDVVDAG